MGSAMPFDEDQPFEEKVKCLADEELLEIWAESQEVENFLSQRLPHDCSPQPAYEQAIIRELSLRMQKRLLGNSQA